MIHNVLSTKEATFKEIEDNFSFCFPEDYKSFFTKYNGVNMEDYYIKVNDLNEDVLVNNLFSTDDKLNRSLTLMFWNHEYKEDIPEHSLLIGDFQDGAFLLLISEGAYKGVYFYDHAYSFEQSNDDCNTYFLAETFSDFLNRIKQNM